VEAVAARDEVALELVRRALVGEADLRPVGLVSLDAPGAGLEQERQPARDPGRDQVLDDLGLPVDHDRAARQLPKRHPVALAVELELDPVVHDPLALEPRADAELAQQVGVSLLDHAGADALLAVLAAPRLDDDGVDPLVLEDACECEPRRPRPDDADLGSHASSASTCPKTRNARLAAGTPQ
jgi:hypothetical protein